MHKPAKYFLVLIVLLVSSLTLLLLYFGRDSGRRQITAIPPIINRAVDSQKLEEDYRTKTKIIVADVVSATEASKIDGTSLAEKARKELLGLKVPSQFKDLHLELVKASDKLLNFFGSGIEEEKLASLDIIKQAKLKYDWLN